MMNDEGKLFVGIDWATETHQVAAVDVTGKLLAERAVPHTAEGLAGMCDWVASFGVPASRVRLAIEMPHGSVVETLLERELAVFSLNPRQLDRFRDRYSMSGAKDDRRDAFVLANALRTDEHCFRRLAFTPEDALVLREWSRVADDLSAERVRLANRLREQLRRYYPQFLKAVRDPSTEWAMALWSKLPAPSKVSGRSKQSIASVLKTHRIRRVTATDVLRVLREPALHVAPGTERAARAHIVLLIERLQLLARQLRSARTELQALLDSMTQAPNEDRSCEQSDATILLSLPGVGPIVAAALLAEAPQPLADRDYHAARALAGVAPVTRRSGKRKPAVHMRRGCNLRLRNALYHWARIATQHDSLSRARYAALRARGHSHGRALRSVADRLLSVLMAMLRTGTTFRANPS